MELNGRVINILGDSITAGGGASAPEFSYPAVLERLLGATVRNYGIGATRIARLVERHPLYNDPSFVDRYQEMDPHADLVIVYGGTNDYGLSNTPFGTPADFCPDTFCGACRMLFSGLIEKYPDTRIVVITPMQRTGDRNPNHTGKALVGYVDAIIEAAAEYSLPVLDLYRTLGLCPDVPVHQERFLPDGLHPNDAGAKRLAEHIAAFLKTL